MNITLIHWKTRPLSPRGSSLEICSVCEMNPFNYSRPTGGDGYAVTEFSAEFQKNSRRDFTREEINEQPRFFSIFREGKKKYHRHCSLNSTCYSIYRIFIPPFPTMNTRRREKKTWLEIVQYLVNRTERPDQTGDHEIGHGQADDQIIGHRLQVPLEQDRSYHEQIPWNKNFPSVSVNVFHSPFLPFPFVFHRRVSNSTSLSLFLSLLSLSLHRIIVPTEIFRTERFSETSHSPFHQRRRYHACPPTRSAFSGQFAATFRESTF